MPTPRLNVLPTLTADGLRGVRSHADFGSRSLAECERNGDQHGAELWQRYTDRWLGKLADLMAS